MNLGICHSLWDTLPYLSYIWNFIDKITFLWLFMFRNEPLWEINPKCCSFWIFPHICDSDSKSENIVVPKLISYHLDIIVNTFVKYSGVRVTKGYLPVPDGYLSVCHGCHYHFCYNIVGWCTCFTPFSTCLFFYKKYVREAPPPSKKQDLLGILPKCQTSLPPFLEPLVLWFFAF